MFVSISHVATALARLLLANTMTDEEVRAFYPDLLGEDPQPIPAWQAIFRVQFLRGPP